MSRINKVNKDHYMIAGRLTPDELARQRRKQEEPLWGATKNRKGKPMPPWMANENPAAEGDAAREEPSETGRDVSGKRQAADGDQENSSRRSATARRSAPGKAKAARKSKAASAKSATTAGRTTAAKSVKSAKKSKSAKTDGARTSGRSAKKSANTSRSAKTGTRKTTTKRSGQTKPRAAKKR